MARRPLILGLWLAGIGALALWLSVSLRMETDLSQFLPAAASLDEQVLLAQMRSGVAARTILAAVEGPATATGPAVSDRAADQAADRAVISPSPRRLPCSGRRPPSASPPPSSMP